jgi:hypothetical protein
VTEEKGDAMISSAQSSRRLAPAALCGLVLLAGALQAFGGEVAPALPREKSESKKSESKNEAASPKKAEPKTEAAAAAGDSAAGMTLKGSEAGTNLPSLTVTGEDRVHFEFERPSLDLDLDPRTAPGLEWSDPMTSLDRAGVDPLGPLADHSITAESPYLAVPWVERFQSGAVTKFRPQVKDVEAWQLTIADSRSDTLAVFGGKGKPPKEITWDGAGRDGKLVPPGITCSYVLEAYDRAGNHRNFVGQGFKLPPYRLTTPNGMALLFSAEEIPRGVSATRAATSTPPPIVIEAASWLNQGPAEGGAIEVTATSRTFEEAKALSDQLVEMLRPRVLGDPGRIRAMTEVRPDAPERGTVTILARS